MADVEVYVRGPVRATAGLLASWSSLTLVQRRNDVGRWTLTLPLADEAILAPGTGVVIRRDGTTLASGWRWPHYSVAVRGAEREWTVSGWDDTVILADTLCWPRPQSAIGSQVDRDNIATGAASTRVRTMFQRNVVDRLVVPGANQGTDPVVGPSGTSRARFRQLLELAQEACGTAVNFRVVQRDSDNALALEFREPEDLRLAVQFSPDVGTVHGWELSDAGPEVTRVIVGAGGEDVDRLFRQRTSTDLGLAGSRESDWQHVRRIEEFHDARGLDPAEPSTPDEADAQADEELLRGRARQSFNLTVSDVPGQRYGVDYLVGDLVRAYAEDVPVDDLVEQVEVTWDADGGERTTVWVGPVDDPDEADARRERSLRRRIRQLETAL